MFGGLIAATCVLFSSLQAWADEAADAAFYAFLDQIYERDVAESPMLASSLGEDRDQDRWDDVSDAALDRKDERTRGELEYLKKNFDPDALSDRAKFHYLVIEDELKLRLERGKWRYHNYTLNQIVGLHLGVAGLLTKQHTVKKPADADAYIARLKGVEPLMADLTAFMKLRNEKGFYGPRSVYPRLLTGARKLVSGAPFEEGEGVADNPIWADFQQKVAALDIPPARKAEYLARAKSALQNEFRTGYQNLIAQLEKEERETKIDGGVWQLPDGDRYYEFLVRQFTTTDMTPAQIHELGLKEVARIHKEMNKIKKEVGFKGDLKAFFTYLKTDPKFYLPETDLGREAYIKTAEAALARMAARIPQAFYELPPISLEVRRFEPYREKSSAAALYEPGAADNSRPGRVFLKLDKMDGAPLPDLEALVYHEGLPGHHMQISTILSDPNMPKLRKQELWYSNSAFVEGWALYAESLAKDLGAYESPYSDFGRLSGELWRACRLVVDSGLHYKRWTREQAIEYLNANTASPEESNIRAVDRYLGVPGQATSFKVGMIKFEEKRDEARKALGDRFDIRGYHQAVLENGYVPLWAMEYWVDHWIEQTKRGEGGGE